MKIAYGRHVAADMVVEQCATQLGGGAVPSLIVAFCGGRHAPDRVRAQLARRFGACPIVGGAAAGAIARDGYGYSGFELILAAFDADDPTPAFAVTDGLDRDERAAGAALGRALAAAGEGFLAPDSVVAIFYDSVATPGQLRLHPAAPLVKGFYDGVGRRDLHVVGGGLLTNMNLDDGWVFTGDGVAKHNAVALAFPPEIGAVTEIMHGCRPASSFLEITAADGAEIRELDGRPALDVLEERLGFALTASNQEQLSLLATLGRKFGDPFAPFDEKAYVNRLILGANRETRTITIFEPDFEIGAKVQIMARDNGLMLDSVRAGASNVVSATQGKRVLMTLYIDCAGRASARSGAAEEEAEAALAASGGLDPIFGFYSGVEIAPFDGESAPLDWTAVMTALYWRTAA